MNGAVNWKNRDKVWELVKKMRSESDSKTRWDIAEEIYELLYV